MIKDNSFTVTSRFLFGPNFLHRSSNKIHDTSYDILRRVGRFQDGAYEANSGFDNRRGVAFMRHIEARYDSGCGATFDYGFMNLSADNSGPRGGVLGAKVYRGVLEALILRRVRSGNSRINFFTGIRWWDTDIDVTVDPTLSSVEYFLRVARQVSHTCRSAVSCGPVFCLIFAPFMDYDEPESLHYKNPSTCLMSADGGH